jgi:O-antigen/teichoic acid export membrane protein
MRLGGAQLRENLKRFAPLAATVALTRGLSIVTIPIVSRYLTPSDYGQLELISTTLEVAGLVLSFGMADTLFRFCADTDERGRRSAAAGLLGAALIGSLVIGILLQLGVFAVLNALPAIGSGTTLRIGLFAATLTGLIELPLAWMRFRGHLGQFFCFMSLRSVAQAVMMILTLRAGFGVGGIIAGNACVDVVIVTALVTRQFFETGVRLDGALIRRTLKYGAPLVGGSLAMFVLGACDRWFLAAYVAVAEIAFYGMAAKLSLAVSLSLQPFSMFWYARRLAVFHQPAGLERSAKAVGLGFVVLTCGALAVAVTGSLFITLALPPSYARAAVFLPWLVAIAFLNEASSLVNVGSYLGHRTTGVMVINAAGAAIALTGYIVLVPHYGVAGAIAATLAGQSLRFILFALHGHKRAPIPYPIPAIAWIVALALLAFAAAPPVSLVAVNVMWMIAALAIIAGLAIRFGMLAVIGIGKASHASR